MSSKASPSRSSSSAGAASRCSPTNRRRSGELARADQRRNRPDALAAVLRGIGTGRDAAAVGAGWASSRCPSRVLAGERDEKFRALGAAHASSCCRDGELHRRRPAGTACRWRARGRGGAGASRRARRRGRARWVARSPRPGGSGSSRPSNSPQRRQAAVRHRPARGQRGGGVHARRRRRAGRRGSRRGRPPRPTRARARRRRAAPRCRRSGRSSGRPRPRRPAPSAPGSAAVSSIATRTATRSRTSRTACRPCAGSSTSSRPAGASASIARDRLLDAPGAVGVQAQRHLRRPRRRATAATRAGVVADAHLQLQAREAVAPRPRAACSATPARSSADERRVDRHLGSGVVAQQRRDGLALAPPGAVPQREVDRRERLRAGRRRLAAGIDAAARRSMLRRRRPARPRSAPARAGRARAGRRRRARAAPLRRSRRGRRGR